MSFAKTFDSIHSYVIQKSFFQIFTAFTRLILAVGFIPPSIIKILNIPFTALPDSHPVGHYFNALYQTGFYYQFLGWGQLTAALLLLIPRTAHLGALIFFPIILNICVLTNSVDFTGTWIITSLMLLACLYLVCWEYDRLKPLVFDSRSEKTRISKLWKYLLTIGFAIGAAFAFFFLAYFHIANLHENFSAAIPVIFAGLIFGTVCYLHVKFMRTGKLENNLDTTK